ncbi:hypothetical protein ACMYR2_3489 [Nitrobacter sp. TKz-YC01]
MEKLPHLPFENVEYDVWTTGSSHLQLREPGFRLGLIGHFRIYPKLRLLAPQSRAARNNSGSTAHSYGIIRFNAAESYLSRIVMRLNARNQWILRSPMDGGWSSAVHGSKRCNEYEASPVRRFHCKR